MLKVFGKIILGAFCGFSLVACQGTSSSAPAPKPTLGGEQLGKQKIDFNSNWAAVTARCLTSDCPEYIASVTSINPAGSEYDVGVCTGFLVAPQIVATNAHCVPHDILKEGADCSQRMQFLFPDGSPTGAKVKCDRVLTFAKNYVHQENKNENRRQGDYALIRLAEPIKRRPLELSAAGFDENENIEIISLNSLGDDSTDRVVRRRSCTSHHFSFLDPSSNAKISPGFYLGDCIAVPGDSGSPVLSDDGHARGILSNALADLSEVRKTLPANFFGQSAQRELAPLATGTSFACLSLPTIGFVAPAAGTPACREEKLRENIDGVKFMQQGLSRFYPADAAVMVADEMIPFMKKHNSLVMWSTRKVPLSAQQKENWGIDQFEMVPECVVPQGSWASGVSGAQTEAFEDRVWLMSLRLNRYYQIRVEESHLSRGQLSYLIDVEKFRKKGKGEITLFRNGTSEKFSVKTCTPEQLREVTREEIMASTQRK